MNIIHLLWVSLLLCLAGCAQDAGPQSEAGTGTSDAPAAAAAQPDAADTDAASAGDVEARVAAGDADKGKRMFLLCQACHSLDAAGANKVGPNLNGVIGRAAGKAEGFIYSAPLLESGIVWDAKSLDQWLQNPAAMVPGTTMVFPGIQDPVQRADLIAYIRDMTGG